ncbi:hypothetical protein N7495_007121 [Penicillium taxi]|uniref:uncharacterized protein n=1 Tax=Penicillium taxi TaxID=168475 RepID=UPI00254532C4|nr:uncharacterized protein N7495_007121 [Penicillium taxi]KAJ5895430.1 hypothetical protein N7495_007121 [Penicillium taxi]
MRMELNSEWVKLEGILVAKFKLLRESGIFKLKGLISYLTVNRFPSATRHSIDHQAEEFEDRTIALKTRLKLKIRSIPAKATEINEASYIFQVMMSVYQAVSSDKKPIGELHRHDEVQR